MLLWWQVCWYALISYRHFLLHGLCNFLICWLLFCWCNTIFGDTLSSCILVCNQTSFASSLCLVSLLTKPPHPKACSSKVGMKEHTHPEIQKPSIPFFTLFYHPLQISTTHLYWPWFNLSGLLDVLGCPFLSRYDIGVVNDRSCAIVQLITHKY